MGTGTRWGQERVCHRVGLEVLALTEGDRIHPDHWTQPPSDEQQLITVCMGRVQGLCLCTGRGQGLHSAHPDVADRPQWPGGAEAAGAVRNVSVRRPGPQDLAKVGSSAQSCSRQAGAWQPAPSSFSWEKPCPVTEPNKKSS